MTIELLRQEFFKPDPRRQPDIADLDYFDPWNIFPCLYGNYSMAFDDMAIEVLIAVSGGPWTKETLAHEMFREILCTSDFCDYGTSPRSCFPTRDFGQYLPELIKRWENYRKVAWE